MNHYFAYVRVSTQKQEDGISLEQQRAAITAYAEQHGLHITRWFEEIRTAARSGRPRFAEMLRELRRNNATGAILHKIDRGARNLHDWAAIGDLIDSGIDVRFAHDDLRLDSRGGRLAADIQAVVAADFIRNLREETRKGIQGRLKQGLFPWKAPLGYIDQAAGRPKARHPFMAALVLEAFERYASGCVSLRELRDLLVAKGLRTTKGNLSISYLAMVLRNPFYLGICQSRGVRYPGIHPPLVSLELFDRVQQVLGRKRVRRWRRAPFLYSRLIAHACGRALVGERQKGPTYYRCHRCPGVLREERLDRLAEDLLRRSNPIPDDARPIAAQLRERFPIVQLEDGCLRPPAGRERLSCAGSIPVGALRGV